MKTDIFNSINSKLTPDQSVITELLRKVENNELPEEPVIETEQAPVEPISESSVIRESVETEAEPKIKVKSKVLPFVAVAAALVLVCTGGFFLLRGSDLKTAPGASDSASEKDMEKLKEANENAKLLFTVVNSSITDMIADGNVGTVEEYKNSDNYGKVIDLNERTERWSGEIIDVNSADYIDYSICSTFRYSGADKGYIYFEIDDENNVVAAQWAESTIEGIVGQYPDPEKDPSAVHKIGYKFLSETQIRDNEDEIWDPLSVLIDDSSVNAEGLTITIERISPLPDGFEQFVDYDTELSWFDDSEEHILKNDSTDAKGRAKLPSEGSINYEFRWSDFGIEPIVGTQYEIKLHIVAQTEGYEGGFHTGESDEFYREMDYSVQFIYFADDLNTVPDVVGLPKEEAEQMLFESGFTCSVRMTWEKDIDSGYVVRQMPEAGEELAEGAEILIFVGDDPDNTLAEVPDVRDMTEEEAVDLIKENDLLPVVEYIQHSDSSSGRVVVQSPAAGTYLDKNSEVKLQISKGVGDLPDNWGLTVHADYITSTGMSLYITSDGSAADCEVSTGTDFKLYKMNGDTFEKLKTVFDDFTWTALGQMIETDAGAETKIAIDWYKVYGELPKGTYKVEKTLWLTSGLDGEQDRREQTFGCVFTVE